MSAIATSDDVRLLGTINRDTLDQPRTSGDILERSAARFADREALVFLPDPSQPGVRTAYSFAELLDMVRRSAAVLRRLGIGRNDVVAFALPNQPLTHFALWGAEAAGVAMAINPALAPSQISGLLAAGNARILISLPHVAAAIELDEVEIVLADEFEALLDRQSEDLRPLDEAASSDLASLFCTGGTTGAPKIAMRTHDTETGNVTAFAAMLESHLNEDGVFLCGLPMFHVNATMVTGLLPWSVGAKVLLAGPEGYRSPSLVERFWEIVERERVTFFAGVPAIFARLLDRPTQGRDLSTLDAALCGAAPMPTDLFRRFEASTGVRIIEGYGLTEGGCVSTANPIDGERRIGSIGLALPWQDLVVAEIDGGGRYVRMCSSDESGSILIAGRNVFAGYRDPTHDIAVWPDLGDGRRWLNTGDLGRIDADGYVWLTGRRKELIIRGGHNIDPAIIEEAMNAHPAVAMTAAVGRPDADVGEVPVAYVQLRLGAQTDEATLLAHARATVPERAAVPKAVHIVPALPLTPVGKIFKPALVMREIERVVAEHALALGVIADVVARQDAHHGAVARIRGPIDTEPLRALLAPYAFSTEFEPN